MPDRGIMVPRATDFGLDGRFDAASRRTREAVEHGASSDPRCVSRFIEETMPGKLLIVSHACVVPANQSVFVFLAERGWDIDLVAPDRWVHEYADGLVPAAKLPELQARFHPLPVALRGQPQRHLYLGGCSALLRRVRPNVAFLEEETFSIPAFQWAVACWRQGVPFGVQAAENLDRPLPLPAKLCRAWTLRHAAFIAARSPTAGQLAKCWGARGPVDVIPHAVPDWPDAVETRRDERFTIGFAGRLVEEKGLFDLTAAARRLPGPVRVLLAGNGPLRRELEQASSESVTVEVAAGIKHEDMAAAFARMDVLVLPSRTTPTWVEQFGRVLVEALWCGVPVIGSSSGEIPWVIETTGGGVVFPEGDIGALAAALTDLRANPDKRARLAEAGRCSVEELFSINGAGSRLDATLVSTVLRHAANASATKL